MTTPIEHGKEHTKEESVEWIVGLSAALAVGVSLPVGIGVGSGLMYWALKKRKQRIHRPEAIRLVVVGTIVWGICWLIRDWGDFKAALIM